METGHVEAPSDLKDAKQLLKTLPIQTPAYPEKSAMDFIAEESEYGSPKNRSAVLPVFMTSLAWGMFALALGALIWMTYATGKEYLH